MEDQEEEGGAAPAANWTCEACGCHTNTEDSTSCGICGIRRNEGGALFRRGGASAASRFLSRAYAIRRAGIGRDDGNPFEEEGAIGIMEQFDDDDVMMQDDEAMAALALEVAGIRGPRGVALGALAGRQRQRDGAPQMNRAAALRNLPRAEDLLRMARENASSYQSPQWADLSQLGGRVRSESGFELGPGDLANVALPPVGSGEGRTVRALNPIPRRPVTSSAEGDADSSTTAQKVFGFKIAFSGPRPQVGASMGGCYLVGVASASFTAFGDRNALQQSPYFWGIEDGGSKFEGPSSRQRGRSSTTYGIEMGRSEVPFNDNDMLFGSQEELTVVVDTEHRTLTYWRNSRLLGTLVTNLPRTGSLFPVAVPFNSGASVAITDMNGNPVQSLQAFDAYWKDEQGRQVEEKRNAVTSQRSLYIQDGKPSPNLLKVLEKIFSSYVNPSDEQVSEEDLCLSLTDASRLWYRCGIRLVNLQRLLEEKRSQESISIDTKVSFQDFVLCITRLVQTDEREWGRIDTSGVPYNNYVLGDVVELVEEYSKYGDAAEGPLQLGDRGRVVEIKEGSIGQKHAKVSFNGQTWWYRSHALLTERSKLIDSAVVWLLRRVVRSHGYDSSTLEPIWGKPVTSETWQYGDIVVPKARQQDESTLLCNANSSFGRVVAPQPTSSGHGRRPRDIGIAQVEFIDPSFGVSTGLFSSSRLGSAPSLHSRQLRVNKLVHARSCCCKETPTEFEASQAPGHVEDESIQGASRFAKENLTGVEFLDTSAIERVTEECRKSITSLSAMFDAGLADAVVRAIDGAERQLIQGEHDVSPALLSLNILLRAITNPLFPEDGENLDGDSAGTRTPPMSPPRTRSRARRTAREDSSSLSQRRSMMARLSSRSRVNSADSQDDGGVGMRGARVALQPRAPAGTAFSALADALRGRILSSVPHDDDDEADEHANATLSTTAVEALSLDSLTWLKSALESSTRLSSRNGRVELAEACKSCDEDGMSLLHLAVRFGCSQDIISYLIHSGSFVGVEEIHAAASSNQVATLSILLRNWAHSEGLLDTSSWPDSALAVFEEAETHRKAQEKKAREKGSELMTALVRKLCLFGLKCHRLQTTEATQSLRAVTEALVGNPLLRVAAHAQENGLSSCPAPAPASRNLSSSAPEVERVSLTRLGSPETATFASTAYGPVSLSNGLLQIAPERVYLNLRAEGVLEGIIDPISALFSFTESFLWSKHCSDVAAGLTCLLSVVKRASPARLSGELDRFGMKDMVCRHKVFAERKLADIQARKALLKAPSESASLNTSSAEDRKSPGVVYCSQCHVAEFHITKHSSFRCDICGKGVDRGQPMHGCRSCDWDACQACTDKGDGGIAKWAHIVELASECERILSRKSVNRGQNDSEMHVGGKLLLDAGELAVRIRERDADAVRDLRCRLALPGLTTIHEFATFLLPALYESILQGDKSPLAMEECTTPTRRTKKPRTRGSFHDGDAKSPGPLICGGHEANSRAVFSELLAPLTENPSAGGDSSAPSGRVVDVMEVEDLEDLIVAIPEGNSGSSSRTPTVPEVIYLLRQILSFTERVEVFHSADPSSGGSDQPKYSSLQSLTEPVELELLSWRQDIIADVPNAQRNSTVVLAEPLAPLADLQQQVLRACRIDDDAYGEYCNMLASRKCVIVMRPRQPSVQAAAKDWQVARVNGYDENTGAHHVQVSTRIANNPRSSDEVVLRWGGPSEYDIFHFEGPDTAVVLASREYFVLGQGLQESTEPESDLEGLDASMELVDDIEEPAGAQASDSLVGRRVETTAGSSDGTWLPCTILCERKERDPDTAARTRRSRATESFRKVYDIVKDDGNVLRSISEQQIRMSNPSDAPSARERGGINFSVSDRSGNVIARSMFPFFGARRSGLDRDSDGSRNANQVGVLKRTWSAISPLQDLNSLDLKMNEPVQRRGESFDPQSGHVWSCSVGTSTVKVFAERALVQKPPKLSVDFGASETLPPLPAKHASDETLFSALCRLRRCSHQDKLAFCQELRKRQKLFYTIRTTSLPKQVAADDILAASSFAPVKVPAFAEMATSGSPLCEEFDATCMQSMEILNEMARYAATCTEEVDGTHASRSDLKQEMFQSDTLTKKLTEQLDDSLVVVANAMPAWTLLGPAFAPRVFSYESRRLLLERTAFGVSRAALKQQEAKVAVGPLRKRMAALRARAVELVGEAFSGGAEDPTALQLQADELYGMEEALASRVQSAFRAQRWRERSLQCAKVSVRRESLLADAAAAMERYACEDAARRRRLEIRFEGESGFDAASGEEAGVTRGFYADVAEALVSADHVSPLHCPPMKSCPDGFASMGGSIECEMEIANVTKLPLWIPDMDSSRHVVIPTPRADPGSTIGVFPRPLAPFDPRMPLVLQQFRFIGRLFASAMRDNFMFPLPLSCAFLKLVQQGRDGVGLGSSEELPTSYITNAEEHLNKKLPPSQLDSGEDSGTRKSLRILDSGDLPRAGFLGGEVAAIESYICEALNQLDTADPPLSKVELAKRSREIASDRNFAKVALGKSFDCSFEEYFEDRTFVDPLDPSQGEEAYRLCPNGHLRQVTIENVREWVALAKDFILHQGVIEQARAFRHGVEDFFPADYLAVLSPEELQRDVCGSGDNVDRWDEKAIRDLFKLDGGTEALVAVAAIGGEGGASLSRRFGQSSPTIGYLVKALMESTSTQRRQFLSFVTSVPIVTPGKIEVVPTVSAAGQFMPMHDPTCLPRANTCARRLYLPKFESYESFASVLHAVIREESKFKGFYEWRG